jgi:hypothetical protein
MSRLYFLAEGRAPNATALQDALTALSGFARFEGAEHEVHVRVAGHQERMYLDLCDAKWRAIEIGVDGWQGQLAGPVRQPPGGHQPAEAKAGQQQRRWLGNTYRFLGRAVREGPYPAAGSN